MIRLARCCLLPLSIAMQDPDSTDIERAFKQLQAQLSPGFEGGPRPPRQLLISRLVTFVERFSDSPRLQSAPQLLNARSRLAGLYLGSFALEMARREFTVILEQAESRDRDLRPRALYGLGQVQELSGKLDAAVNTLRRILRSYEGTRYATYAKIALQRIDSKTHAEIGKLAPAIRPHLDLTGKARDLASLLGEPVLLLFWSPDHERGLAQITTLLEAATEAGLGKRQILSFGLHADTDQLRDAIEEQGWEVPVIPLNHEFLDPLVVNYGLRSIPSSFLIGPDGTLLARNLSPRRLAEALRALR